MNVEYLHRFPVDAIENAVGVSHERHDANVGPLLDAAGAVRPLSDPRDDRMHALLKGRDDRRIVFGGIREDRVQVGERRLGPDNPHPRRCLAKTASLKAWLA